MTVTAERVSATRVAPSRPLGQQIVRVLTTTDHKVIGKLYMATSFGWFIGDGILALLIGSELAFPGSQLGNDEVYNVYKSSFGPKVTVDDPGGWGCPLEWATRCPPPRHNFVAVPRIGSESPAFDLHHPEIAEREFADQPGSEVR